MDQSTGASSNISRTFGFDAEIVGSAVYQRAVRSLFKRTVGRRGRAVESLITQERYYKKVEVALVGTNESAEEIIMNDIQARNRPTYDTAELIFCQESVFEAVVDSIYIVLEYLECISMDLTTDIEKEHAELLRQSIPGYKITPELKVAIQHIVGSYIVERVLQLPGKYTGEQILDQAR
jgi:hypothetical protein